MAITMTENERIAAVKLENISKAFGSVLANDSISLEIPAGSIHALLGENGAGKSTLMNILYGLIQPDCGVIKIHGKPVIMKSPAIANQHRIAMVHQHFMLVPNFTVVENIVLGLPANARGKFMDLKEPVEKIKQLSKKYGLEVNPTAEVSTLSVGEQQRVEILKALYRDADILILDEPTSVLTPQEVDQLFQILKQFRADGHTVIFISHKLNEIMEISDEVTVFRDGQRIKTIDTADASIKELAYLMVGRDISLEISSVRRKPSRDAIFEVKDLWVKGSSGFGLSGLSFQMHAGEILGIAGVDGNGQKELSESIFGLASVEKGKIILNGKDVTNSTPAQALGCGVAYLPPDRLESGLLGSLPIWRNMLLGNQSKQPYSKNGWLQKKAIRARTQNLINTFDIRPSDPKWLAGSLSGGNQQKVMLARQLSLKPKLLIVNQPTAGLDIRTIEYVRRMLLEERNQGRAILLISTDLQEILALSDRILVLYEGRAMGTVPISEAMTENLGLMMAGVSPHEVN